MKAILLLFLLPVLLVCSVQDLFAAFPVMSKKVFVLPVAAPPAVPVLTKRKSTDATTHVATLRQATSYHAPYHEHTYAYRALMFGLLGIVVLPLGFKAIEYAGYSRRYSYRMKGQSVMATIGKVLGIIESSLFIGILFALLGWFIYKNPSSGTFFLDMLGAIGQGLADGAGN